MLHACRTDPLQACSVDSLTLELMCMYIISFSTAAWPTALLTRELLAIKLSDALLAGKHRGLEKAFVPGGFYNDKGDWVHVVPQRSTALQHNDQGLDRLLGGVSPNLGWQGC